MSEPNLLERIAEVTSQEVADKLSDVYGGLTIFFNSVRFQGSQLARVIGSDNVEKIARGFGCGKVRIPLGSRRGLNARQAYLEALLRQGASCRDAAWVVGVHERTAENARQRLRRQARST